MVTHHQGRRDKRPSDASMSMCEGCRHHVTYQRLRCIVCKKLLCKECRVKVDPHARNREVICRRGEGKKHG